jgi:hypothetical protein
MARYGAPCDPAADAEKPVTGTVGYFRNSVLYRAVLRTGTPGLLITLTHQWLYEEVVGTVACCDSGVKVRFEAAGMSSDDERRPS